MSKRKNIDLEHFLFLFNQFISIPTWTKQKHQQLDNLNTYLGGLHCVKISVIKHSKYNLCKDTNSFTLFKVPSDKRGKLSAYRNKWVFVRCVSDGSGWTRYYNECYPLMNRIPDKILIEDLKKRFSLHYVEQTDTTSKM